MSSQSFWGRLQPQYFILKMKTAGLSKILVNFYWHWNTSQKTILEVLVSAYWVMNIAGIVSQSLDLNTVWFMMESQWIVQRLVLCNTQTQNILLYYQV